MGETVVEKGGSTSGRSCPWCPAPISSRRSSSHSWPLVMSSRRSTPPRRSGRTGHGTGRLRTVEIVEWMARRDTKTRKTAESARDNPPLSSSSCAQTVLTHTSLLMTYTRRRLRGEQTGVTGHEEEKPMSSLGRWNKILNWLFIHFLDQASIIITIITSITELQYADSDALVTHWEGPTATSRCFYNIIQAAWTGSEHQEDPGPLPATSQHNCASFTSKYLRQWDQSGNCGPLHLLQEPPVPQGKHWWGSTPGISRDWERGSLKTRTSKPGQRFCTNPTLHQNVDPGSASSPTWSPTYLTTSYCQWWWWTVPNRAHRGSAIYRISLHP